MKLLIRSLCLFLATLAASVASGQVTVPSANALIIAQRNSVNTANKQTQYYPDPGADRILYWNDTTNFYGNVTIGSGLTFSGGTLSATGGGSGDVATDAIWNAAGDLAVGTGVDTAARLAIGTALQVLRVNAGATGLEWAAPAGGGDALVANPLSQFAATTSAQLRGVLTDESGTGEFLTTTGSAAGLTSFPTLNQNTTGSAATLTTARTINGTSFNGSANISVSSTVSQISDASANGRSLISAANYAAMRTLLDLESGTDFLAFPTGTPDGTKFLRDDNTWQSIPGGGDALVANPLTQFSGILPTNTEFNFVDGVTSAIQTQLDAKAPLASPTFTGTVTIPTPFTLGAVSVLPTGTELNFVDGVTSAIQTQLDAKQATMSGGTDGIDLAGATINFDTTEVAGSKTWGDGSTDTVVWTFNRATGTDPTITFGDNLITMSPISVASTTTDSFLVLDNVDQSHGLSFVIASDLTDNRTLTITTGDANRTLTINGDVTLPAGTVLVSGGALGTPSSGDGTNLTNVPGTTGVYRTIWIDAAAMVPRTTAGAATSTTETATNDIMIDALLFDGATSEGAQFKLMMPDEWNLSTVKVKVFWDAATGASAADTVEWEVAAGALSNDDAIDAALGTAVTVGDVVIAVGDVHVTAASGALTVGGTPALGDLVVWQIIRDPAGTDDMTEDARLLGVAIQYLESTTEPSAW